MEPNREKIIKALECCYMQELEHNENCPECPYTDLYPNCFEYLGKNALALINSQEQRIKELTEVVERSETAGGCKESVDNGFSPSVTELQRENERLRAENAKHEAENHSQFDKWLKLEEATKRHHSKLFEEAKIAVKEDTVRKMEHLLIDEIFKVARCQLTRDEPNVTDQEVRAIIKRIAKEMLERENEGAE